MADIVIAGSTRVHTIQGSSSNRIQMAPNTQPVVKPNATPRASKSPLRSYGHFSPSRIDMRMGKLRDVNVWLAADDWVLVKSSNIAAIKYNQEKRILHVMFRSSTRYEYDMVPEQVAVAFFSAKSLGKFLNAKIKGSYTHRGPFSANTRTIQTIRVPTNP